MSTSEPNFILMPPADQVIDNTSAWVCLLCVYAVQPAKSEEWGSGKLTGTSSARDLKGFQKRVVFKDAKMLKVTFGGQTWMV